MSEKITTLGAGSWGTALANVFADAGGDVQIWGRDAAVVAAIQARHENPKYLPRQPLSSSLSATTDLKAAIDRAGVLVCAIPTQKIRSVLAPTHRCAKSEEARRRSTP